MLIFYSVSLAQLVEQLYNICRGPGFKVRLSHLFTLRVEFLATRLLDKKKRSF
jgi:hypothetical protein